MKRDVRIVYDNLTITRHDLPNGQMSDYHLSIKGCPLYPWCTFKSKGELINHFQDGKIKTDLMEML